MASKITPTTTPTRSNSPPPPPTSTSLHTRPPSADPGSSGGPDRDGASNVRNVPVRVYLPDGPVLQDLVPPVLEDGASRLLPSLAHALLISSFLAHTNPCAHPISTPGR